MADNSQVHIALCTDTHFWFGSPQAFGPEGEQLQPWSEEIYTTLLAQLRAAKPDLVLHLGDYTCGGGTFRMPEDAFFQTLSRTHNGLRSLPAFYYGLPGNHDCPSGTVDYSFCEGLLGLQPKQGRTIDLPGFRLVLLNATGYTPEQVAEALPEDPVYGWVAQEELIRLDRALATAGDRPVLLFVHQLLKPWSAPKPWQDFYGVKNADRVLSIMARYGNVRAVFQGHAHLFDVQQAPVGDSITHFIVAPPIIQYPMAWLSLRLRPDQLHLRMVPLPLPELAERSRQAGNGQGWRAGLPQWQDMRIPLA